jgi:hypothetical protein
MVELLWSVLLSNAAYRQGNRGAREKSEQWRDFVVCAVLG